jgi:dTDP-4-dehydrorhamnose reductase
MDKTTMTKSVLITGAKGQLGLSLRAIAKQFPALQLTYVDIDEFDLCNAPSVERFFKEQTFDFIINCAAYTAVDKAESEPDLADQINHLAVKQLARIAKQKNSILIHISTDYVFNGQHFQPYIEDDQVDPQSVYGATKLKGEQAFQSESPKGIIIRTSWVYSEFGHNFVKSMLRLGQERESLQIIFDQVGTPTYASDLAKTILTIIQSDTLEQSQNNGQLYHYSNEGVCSWYDFAQHIFEISQVHCQVQPIESKDYPTAAQRPFYSLMNKAKIKSHFNLEIPYWKDSLALCIQNIQEKTS